jgi:cyanate lyase
MDVTTMLKKAKEESGLSYAEIKAQTGITRGNLWGMVNGKISISPTVVDPIVECFNLDRDTFMQAWIEDRQNRTDCRVSKMLETRKKK